jgi:anti-sigma-K factor RskA
MTTPDRDPAAERILDYVLGQLPAEERHAVERDVAADPALADEVRRLRGALGLLPYASATDPPPALRARVLAAVRSLDEARARRPGRRVVWSRFVAAAAATLAVALGIETWRLHRDLALERQLTAALQEPNVVQRFALAGAAGGYGTVALDLDAKKGAVVLHGMAPLPPGRIYRLWARVRDTDVPCGDFHVAADGSVVAQFAVPVESYKGPVRQLFVTVEAPGAGAAPTGAPVLASS